MNSKYLVKSTLVDVVHPVVLKKVFAFVPEMPEPFKDIVVSVAPVRSVVRTLF